MAKKNKRNYWLSLTGIAVQMGVIIYLGAWGGRTLDEEQGDGGNTYTIILTLLAVAVSMYLVVRQTKNLHE
ncbi:MAG: AtpZ/AtpI family protein [Bacteroidia bacterium]|nr:AtpZ/AtpI family protein [Bacteroidia bacterium]